MSGHPADQLRPEDAHVINAIGKHYDITRHELTEASRSAPLDNDFIDRFAVVGPPEDCIRRLRQLIAVGLDRFMVVVGSNRVMPEDYAESRRLLTQVVIPALR
jgi:5,10-methylenetetrahydromethanopterin reductase